MKKKRAIIIVAGGKGIRMGGELPKQFLPLKGRSVLMRTLDLFQTYDPEMMIVVVLPKDQQTYWKKLCADSSFSVPHRIADGGETRFHSVRNGLALIQGAEIVGVHDGVRPLVNQEVIARCYTLAEEKKAVIPVLNVVETLRKVAPIHETVNRDEYRLVQTPQVFATDLLKKAYQQPYSPSFTDDASVVEALGEEIALTEGNRENIKLTTPFDLRIAEALLSVNERGV